MARKTRNRIIENITIDKIAYGGVGIGKIKDGKKVIIKGGALPGSIVDIRVTRNRKDMVQGHILKVHSLDQEYSDGKVFCAHYFSLVGIKNKEQLDMTKIGCGGCKRQVMSYKKQLEIKEKIVGESFQKIILDQGTNFLPIIASPKEKNYRNKIEFSFGKYLKKFYREDFPEKADQFEIQAHWNLGFHKQGEFSKIVDIENCGLISDRANEVFAYIKNLLKESGLPVYDQKTHEGFFRHLVIREGINTEQLLVNLVVAEQYFTQTKREKVRKTMKENLKKNEFLQEYITTFIVTNNNGLADTVKGPDITTAVLRGEGYIFEKLQLTVGENVGETTFRVSPFSFFQTNTFGAQQLFSTAAELLGNVVGTVLDLYCGTGTIGLSFLDSKIGNELVGIEIVADAIVDAKKNAEINGLAEQSFFVAGAAEKVIHDNKEIADKIKNLNLVIVDPPREGLHKDVVNFLLDLKKEQKFKLLYISCNPVTMARDVGLLTQGGMKFKTLQAVDMFPQTHHIECIGILV